MSRHLTRQEAVEHADIVLAPQVQARAATKVDRSFELPKGLYLTTVALYLGFIAVLVLGFSTPGLLIPAAIFTIIITAGFKVPAIWAQMKPDSGQAPMGWGHFQSRGIKTLTGHLTAGEATVQVLILPVLILLWGFAVVTIRAFVG